MAGFYDYYTRSAIFARAVDLLTERVGIDWGNLFGSNRSREDAIYQDMLEPLERLIRKNRKLAQDKEIPKSDMLGLAQAVARRLDMYRGMLPVEFKDIVSSDLNGIPLFADFAAQKCPNIAKELGLKGRPEKPARIVIEVDHTVQAIAPETFPKDALPPEWSNAIAVCRDNRLKTIVTPDEPGKNFLATLFKFDEDDQTRFLNGGDGFYKQAEKVAQELRGKLKKKPKRPLTLEQFKILLEEYARHTEFCLKTLEHVDIKPLGKKGLDRFDGFHGWFEAGAHCSSHTQNVIEKCKGGIRAELGAAHNEASTLDRNIEEVRAAVKDKCTTAQWAEDLLAEMLANYHGYVKKHLREKKQEMQALKQFADAFFKDRYPTIGITVVPSVAANPATTSLSGATGVAVLPQTSNGEKKNTKTSASRLLLGGGAAASALVTLAAVAVPDNRPPARGEERKPHWSFGRIAAVTVGVLLTAGLLFGAMRGGPLAEGRKNTPVARV